jgi:hypothetical protein
MAPRPGPRAHRHRAPGPARPVHRHLQHPPAEPVPGPSRHPATAYAARPNATPGDRAADTHDRVRTDIIGTTGTVTLRTGGKLYHIGAGRTHAGTHVLLLVRDLHIRIIDAATGELLRELTLDPDRNYQPTGRPPGLTPRNLRANQKTPNLTLVRGVLDVSRHHTGLAAGIEPTFARHSGCSRPHAV